MSDEKHPMLGLAVICTLVGVALLLCAAVFYMVRTDARLDALEKQHAFAETPMDVAPLPTKRETASREGAGGHSP